MTPTAALLPATTYAEPPPATPPAAEQPPRERMFSIGIDPVTMPQAAERVWRWIRSEPEAGGDARCRFIVTPNVDHAVNLQDRSDFRRAYEAAGLVVADGWPLVAASRLLGKPLPERVAGSDLVPQLFTDTAVRGPLRVFLLGGMPGVAEIAADRIHQRWRRVEVAGVMSPPYGFERSDRENRRILDAIRRVQPDLLVVGFGAPKQELWLHRHQDQIAAKAAIAAGATIDFFAGRQRRAPRWVRRSGLEWLYRLASDPRRLAYRYFRGAWRFPLLVGNEMLSAQTN